MPEIRTVRSVPPAPVCANPNCEYCTQHEYVRPALVTEIPADHGTSELLFGKVERKLIGYNHTTAKGRVRRS